MTHTTCFITGLYLGAGIMAVIMCFCRIAGDSDAERADVVRSERLEGE